MEIDFNFIKLDLENSLTPDEPPSKPFDAQRGLRERADAIRRAGSEPVLTDVFDRALQKLLHGDLPAAPISKLPAALASGHEWPNGYKPSILDEPFPSIVQRVSARSDDKDKKFLQQFSHFLEEFAV